MPIFEYKGINAKGKKVEGVFDSENQRSLRDSLKSKGIFLTEVIESKAGGTSSGNRDVKIKKVINSGIGIRDVSVVTRQLATLLKAGIPLVEALTALVDQTEKDALKRVLASVRGKVNEGSSLHGAMREYPKAFSVLYCNMVKAGEASGNLDVVLERLTEYLESQLGLRMRVISALMYPILMGIMGVGIVGFLFVFVIPKVTDIFKEQKQTLPLVTEILINISTFTADYWLLILILIVLFSTGFYYWKKSETGKPLWDRFVLKTPIFGVLVRMIAVTRFSSTLSTMLLSGVPLLNALAIVSNIMGNSRLIEVVEIARKNIKEGDSLASPLKKSGEFPPMMTHMIAIGERSGQLEEMLNNVSDAYEQQVNMRITALTTLLEPMMIIGMGLVVAFVVFAILLPILKINEGIIG